jgi:hypothetical protein
MLVGPEVIVNQDPYLDLIQLVGINKFNHLIIFYNLKTDIETRINNNKKFHTAQV